jgi:hypothetical protein
MSGDDQVRERAKFFMSDIGKNRDKALTYTKRCPECDTEQVQLVDYSEVGCGWKCRKCKKEWRFDYEYAEMVKIVCYDCKDFNPKAKHKYKCAVKRSCPARNGWTIQEHHKTRLA